MTPAESAVLIVIDGLRPEAIEPARTPTLCRLMARGASTLRARTVMPSITLPCIASMFLGTDPSRHGVTSNTWPAPSPAFPSLIDLVRKAGKPAMSFYNWEPLRDLSRPGGLNVSFFVDTSHDLGGDAEVARAAADRLGRQTFGFAFVYLGCTDTAGHSHGWMSPTYLQETARADAGVAAILDALRATGRLDGTAILVAIDHGGHDKTHGDDRPESMTVPWMLTSPGIPAGRRIDGPVSIIDTAPTLAALLGVETPTTWTGRAVTEAWTNG